ncbi:MAG: aldo/keto reductase, partial [Armatimonadetes bacterium]|nr:aldo/keto reductase [Armatimonadota bacterium]
ALSNYSADQTKLALAVCEANGFVKPILHQPSYSLLNRWIENGLTDVCGEKGVGLIAFCPLAQGLLTNKYLGGTIPEDSRAKQPSGFLKESAVTPEVLAKLEKLNAIAADRGQTLAQLSLSWVLRDSRMTSALIGASRPEQITENVKAAEKTKFADDEIAAIEEALK